MVLQALRPERVGRLLNIDLCPSGFAGGNMQSDVCGLHWAITKRVMATRAEVFRGDLRT